MFANALLATTVIVMGLALLLMQECQFLIPYRRLLILKYGSPILLFVVFLFINVFAAAYFIGRRLFLKDTGRKLAHMEKQLRTSRSISEELSRRLDEE